MKDKKNIYGAQLAICNAGFRGFASLSSQRQVSTHQTK